MTVNRSKLAVEMLQWEEKMRELQALEESIRDAVLELKQTQTVGLVRATYSQGRRDLDWETPGSTAEQETIDLHSEFETYVDWEAACKKADVPQGIIDMYTEVNRIVNWRAVCKDADLPPNVLGQADPSVKIKLLE